MDDGQDKSDESCDADEVRSNDQSKSVCEDADSQSVTSVDEASSQNVIKSSSARPSSSGVYQGPHDWRKNLRPVSKLAHHGNCGGDGRVKSPTGTRQRDSTDVTSFRLEFTQLDYYSLQNSLSLCVLIAILQVILA